MSRRQFGLATGVIGAGVAVAGRPAGAAAVEPARGRTGVTTSHGAIAVEHLLRRATYGATPAQLAAAEKLGTTAWLERQLAPSKISDTAMDSLLKRWPTQRLNTWQIRESFNFGTWEIMEDLIDTHIARAAWSNRQLLELMVDFWSNHLNVTCPSSDVWDNRHLYDQQVIRRHALGKFSDMLCAAAKAPAMLQYLGTAQSSWQEPNENWGRELLELHTVTLAANYTQTDVLNSARILTGLSVDNEGGQYEYKPWHHWAGHVKVLGFSAANSTQAGGEAVAMSYLKYLAHHKLTAHNIARKLCVRFVSDNPPASLVSRLATTYLANDTAIVPVLRQLFHSKEFAESVGHKVRTPYEDFIATIRMLQIKSPAKGTDAIRSLQWMTGSVGQPPLGWHAPNGYVDVAEYWASTSATLGKWNLHMDLAAQWYPKGLQYRYLPSFVPSPLPKTYGALMAGLAKMLNVPALNGTQVAGLAPSSATHPVTRSPRPTRRSGGGFRT